MLVSRWCDYAGTSEYAFPVPDQFPSVINRWKMNKTLLLCCSSFPRSCVLVRLSHSALHVAGNLHRLTSTYFSVRHGDSSLITPRLLKTSLSWHWIELRNFIPRLFLKLTNCPNVMIKCLKHGKWKFCVQALLLLRFKLCNLSFVVCFPANNISVSKKTVPTSNVMGAALWNPLHQEVMWALV